MIIKKKFCKYFDNIIQNYKYRVWFSKIKQLTFMLKNKYSEYNNKQDNFKVIFISILISKAKYIYFLFFLFFFFFVNLIFWPIALRNSGRLITSDLYLLHNSLSFCWCSRTGLRTLFLGSVLLRTSISTIWISVPTCCTTLHRDGFSVPTRCLNALFPDSHVLSRSFSPSM